MSKTEHKTLTDEEKSTKIAELCPFVMWTGPSGSRTPFWEFNGRHPDFDPINDLNAMHEAEKMLDSYAQQEKYLSMLYTLSRESEDEPEDWTLCHATTRHRAEALGLTMRLWT